MPSLTEPDTEIFWPVDDANPDPEPLPPRPRPWWDLRPYEAVIETHFAGDRLLAIRAWTEAGLDRKLERREQARHRVLVRLGMAEYWPVIE